LKFRNRRSWQGDRYHLDRKKKR